MDKVQKIGLLFGLALVAALAVPSVFAYGYGSNNGYPPYGEYWGYNPWTSHNYVSPPIYISYRGGDNCVLGVRSAYWGGFSDCSSYQYNAVRPWGSSPYQGIRYMGPTSYGGYGDRSRGGYGWGY